jgi:hypothetical protein
MPDRASSGSPEAGAGPAFEEAIQYFRDKLRMPSLTWTDLW